MHFCVSAARVGTASLSTTAPAHLSTSAFLSPRKMGTNWFMPALVKSRFGLSGISEDDGTMVCFFSRKKSRNDCLIWAEVIMCRKVANPDQATRNALRGLRKRWRAGRWRIWALVSMARSGVLGKRNAKVADPRANALLD